MYMYMVVIQLQSVDLTFLSPHLSLQTLNQVADGHPGGNGVGVHDDVGSDPLAGERHVLLMVGDATGPLLAMATGKLIPYLWHPHRAYPNLTELVPILID